MKYRHLIFDFDGVLVESNEIRFNGFRSLFKDYPKNQVNQLIAYAQANGGVSRYEKIKYFFNEIRKEPVSSDKMDALASQFSQLVKHKVIEAPPVAGSIQFLSDYSTSFDFTLVSGSDQTELRAICKSRRIHHFFKRILGSPTSKKNNIFNLLKSCQWKKEESVYIGDSKNDLNAARDNNIDFIGRCSGLVDWGKTNVKSVLDLSTLAPLLTKVPETLSKAK